MTILFWDLLTFRGTFFCPIYSFLLMSNKNLDFFFQNHIWEWSTAQKYVPNPLVPLSHLFGYYRNFFVPYTYSFCEKKDFENFLMLSRVVIFHQTTVQSNRVVLYANGIWHQMMRKMQRFLYINDAFASKHLHL